MRSKSTSNASQIATSPACTPANKRPSILCAISPIRIAPVIRALPLRVCSSRFNNCKDGSSSGVARKIRKQLPVLGPNSSTSSRNTGNNCISTSSRKIAFCSFATGVTGCASTGMGCSVAVTASAATAFSTGTSSTSGNAVEGSAIIAADSATSEVCSDSPMTVSLSSNTRRTSSSRGCGICLLQILPTISSSADTTSSSICNCSTPGLAKRSICVCNQPSRAAAKRTTAVKPVLRHTPASV